MSDTSSDPGTTSDQTTAVPEPDVDGLVRGDSLTRQLYSTDASIYKIRPECVVFPFSREDVLTLHRWSKRHNVTLIPRGAGTSLSGQAIGSGAIIDYSKQLNEIIEFDPGGETVRVQPGVVLENLNQYLNEFEYQFGPDVATDNRATIGGMVGNNSAGAHSIRYGQTADHVHSLRCVLSNGEEVTFEPVSLNEARSRAEQNNREGELYRVVPEMVRHHADVIDEAYPEIMRNVSGYALDRFLDALREGVVDFTQLICGSEGSLASIIEARLEVVPTVKSTGLLVVECPSLESALQINRRAIRENPLAVELLDEKLLGLARDSREFSRYLEWLEGDPEAVVMIEVGTSQDPDSLVRVMGRIREALEEDAFPGTIHEITDPQLQDHVWKVRKSGLPLLLGISGDRKPTTFVEDTAVDPPRLESYVRDFQQLADSYGTEAAFYGHSSVGCLHIRPLINLKTASGTGAMRSMARDVVSLVQDYNGSLSGEHGDGRSRSEWLDDFYGRTVTDLFDEIKTVFDPERRLNPGIITDADPMDENLRFGENYETSPPETVQSFEEQGGFTEIIELCNGSGVCRKENSGTMCPSYMVTRDEKHSTRGRANALRGLLDGDLAPEALTDGRLAEVMDLCISCKACKTECPSGVDMAPLKEEILHRIHQSEGSSFSSRVFASIGRIARLLAPLQPLPTILNSLPGVESFIKRLIGTAPDRSLPSFASDPFKADNYPSDPGSVDYPVVLYVDTFSGYFQPGVARRAVDVFEGLGFDPIVPGTPCCGRTYMSKGFLNRAKTQVEETLEVLYPYARQEIPIVTLEPSCHSVLVDDLPRYLPGGKARKIVDQSLLFSSFLINSSGVNVEELGNEYEKDLVLHGHCHQKALVGKNDLVSLMETISTGEVSFVDSGCCGMAGSFGYQAEHYRYSEKMARRELVPRIETSPNSSRVVAPGISCRQQIEHFTGTTAHHPAEIVAAASPSPNGRGPGS